MNIDCKAEFPRHRESRVVCLVLGAVALTLWADAAGATAGSSTGGSSSTGSTGIAGGVSTDAAAYLFAPVFSGLLGAWLALRQNAAHWLTGLSACRRWLGVFYFSACAYSLADVHGALLWCGISLVHLLSEKQGQGEDTKRQIEGGWWQKCSPELCMAFAWMAFQSTVPALGLLMAPCWLMTWTQRDGKIQQRLPVITASLIVMLLGFRESLDPIFARTMAQASAWLLSGTGAAVQLDGATLLGLRVPVHVTAACAGTVVTLTPFALGAMLSALWRSPLRVRWQATLGLGLAAAIINLARIAGVGVSSLWWNAEQMQLFHDVIGWPLAIMLYAGFGLWLRRALRPPATG